MRNLKYALLACLCLTIFSSLAIFAGVNDDQPRPVRIRVKNNLEQTVSNASVQIFTYGTNTLLATDVTDSNGEVQFLTVNPGTYYTKVAAYGYSPTEELFVVSTSPVVVDVTMD